MSMLRSMTTPSSICDLAWMPVSSVDPPRWDDAIAPYRHSDRLEEALPAVMMQALFSLADTPAGTAEAAAWVERMDAAGSRLSRALPEQPGRRLSAAAGGVAKYRAEAGHRGAEGMSRRGGVADDKGRAEVLLAGPESCEAEQGQS